MRERTQQPERDREHPAATSWEADGGFRDGLGTPAIELPKGGGAVRGVDESISANPATGSAGVTIPLPLTPGRAGFTPELALAYDSGAGATEFGLGWSVGPAAIGRKTARGLPRYRADDTFALATGEDLVPLLEADDAGTWHPVPLAARRLGGRDYLVAQFRPRIEGGFAWIERWTARDDPADCFWRSISGDNTTRWYGRTDESRIRDPADPLRIFRWLLCEVTDGRGQAIRYGYKAEDSAGLDPPPLNEANRRAAGRSAMRYLKRVRYGNMAPYFPALDPELPESLPEAFHFELVFDYGEHDPQAPTSGDAGTWALRPDPIASGRPGFELLTYRLCRRVLMFHHFPDEAGVGADCLVAALELEHGAAAEGGFSLLTGLAAAAFRRAGAGYDRHAAPPAHLSYSQGNIASAPAALGAIPAGLADPATAWSDLEANALGGALTRVQGAWYLRPNLGPGPGPPDGSGRADWRGLGPPAALADLPSAAADPGAGQLADPGAEGRMALVEFDGPAPGLYPRSAGRWEPQRAFRSLPNIDYADPDLRLIDLTGDGRADLLLTQEAALTWYPSLGTEGFGPPEAVAQALDADRGPRVLLSEAHQSVFLADMTGDGLSDLVRIANGAVSYWPNLGYGRFGARVAMAGAPWFDTLEAFDPAWLRLADVDGSGPSDMIYCGAAGTTLWRNLAGNGWSAGERLSGAPTRDSETRLEVLDLKGNGTACLVWSAPLPAEAGRALRHLDLTGGIKPHLLTAIENGIGSETRLDYAPSTRFQTEDAAAGRPWITTLPFVVQCLHRVERRDAITRNRFVSEHSYHHGYYDAEEREFAGFARTENRDMEAVGTLAQEDPLAAGGAELMATSRPPVLLRQWHHTGAAFQPEGIVARLRAEMWREPGDGDAGLRLADAPLPDGLDTRAKREAARALRGSLLRSETYALDGTAAAETPVSVSESRARLRLVQPRGPNRHAVFLVVPGESLSLAYDRDPADPRVSHGLTLATDAFGNVLRSAQVAYGRRAADPGFAPADAARQLEPAVILAEARFTASVLGEDARRLPVPSGAARYELAGVPPPPAGRYRPADLVAAFDSLPRLPPEALASGAPALRLIGRWEALYRRDDLSGPLPLDVAEPLALPFEAYGLAFTDAQLSGVFGARLGADAEALLAGDGGYLRRPGSDPGAWWAPSGRVRFSPDPDATPAEELAEARAAFFQIRRSEDAYGNAALVGYDRYTLLPVDSADALGNRVTAGARAADGTAAPDIDYRLMVPRSVTDANGDRTAAAFDIAGRVVATARLGRPGEDTGESLAGIETDPDTDTLDAVFSDPTGPQARALIGAAAARSLFDDSRFARLGLPVASAALARQRHDAAGDDPLEVAVSHGDGAGRTAQSKTLVAPGPVGPGDTAETTRWHSDGWTVLNAKGAPVRRWEPFFTRSSAFEPALETGVSSVMLYDALDRPRGTLHPDGSWEKTDITPWQVVQHSANDLALDPPQGDALLGPEVLLLPETFYNPTWHELRTAPAHAAAFAARFPDAADRSEETAAAAKTAALAHSPKIAHIDALGRTFLTQAGDGAGQVLEMRTREDIAGLPLATIDARGITVLHHLPVTASGAQMRGHDAAGRTLYGLEADEGETRVLPGVDGQPIRSWTPRGDVLRTSYDALRRPTHLHLAGPAGPERLVERMVYGEAHPDPAARLRTRLHRRYGAEGEETALGHDFMGNAVGSRRRLRRSYAGPQDWAALEGLEDAEAIHAAALPFLETEEFTASAAYDLQGRPVEATAPDGSLTRMHYDIAGALARVEVRPRGAGPVRTVLAAIRYNAFGQLETATYALAGGGTVELREAHDPETRRLRRLTATRSGDGRILQDLRYAYDVAGHVTAIRDDAQQAVFFANAVVPPRADFTYDPLGRLVEARGREHAPSNHVQRDAVPGEPMIGLPFVNDAAALQRYVQRYGYDAAGNIVSLSHQGGGLPRWRRCYQYATDSNRLLATSAPGESGAEAACPAPHVTVPSLSARYGYDAGGCMASMPHLPVMRWDFRGRLAATARQVVNAGTPETTHYVCDATGTRLRKVTDRAAAAGVEPVRRRERISLGVWERYREYGPDGTTVTQERITLHVADAGGRVALVETETVAAGAPVAVEQPQIRFQFGNHLGSAVLELDEAGAVIAYEEFHPFGTTAYLGGRSVAEVRARRFRYIGRERDEESGLSHHGVRYYAPWLARWTSPDPLGTGDGLNRYRYAGNDPVGALDGSGLAGESRTIRVSQDPDVAYRRNLADYQRDLAKYDIAKRSFDQEEQDLSFEVQAAVRAGLDYASDALSKRYRELRSEWRNLDAARLAYRIALARAREKEAEIAAVKQTFRNAEGFVNRFALFVGVSIGVSFLAPALPGGLAGSTLGGATEGALFSAGESAVTDVEGGRDIDFGAAASSGVEGGAYGAAGGAAGYGLGALFGRIVRAIRGPGPSTVGEAIGDGLPKLTQLFKNKDAYVARLARVIEARYPGTVSQVGINRDLPGGGYIEVDIELRINIDIEVKSGTGSTRLFGQMSKRETKFGRVQLGYAPDWKGRPRPSVLSGDPQFEVPSGTLSTRRAGNASMDPDKWQSWHLITNTEKQILFWIGQFK